MLFAKRSVDSLPGMAQLSNPVFVRDLAADFQAERNHQGMGNRPLIPGSEVGLTSGEIACREHLGGLLRYYYRKAARTSSAYHSDRLEAECRVRSCLRTAGKTKRKAENSARQLPESRAGTI